MYSGPSINPIDPLLPDDEFFATWLSFPDEVKRDPARDIDTATVDSLKVLDPERPIRESIIRQRAMYHRLLACSLKMFPRSFNDVELFSEGYPLAVHRA
jgi:hypothetical protein